MATSPGNLSSTEGLPEPRAGRMIRRVTMLAGAFAALAGLTVLAIGGVRALQPGDEVPTHPLVLSGYDDPGGVYDRPLNIVATPTPAPMPVEVAIPAAPPLRDIPYRLIIDKIGVNAPVGTYGLGADQIPDVPSNGQEVAWYDFSSQPGTGSNAVFAGHVTWSGRGVFYHLDDLAAGDQVTLVANNGGAVALGHPLGASGTRLLGTMAYEMNRQDAEWGLATLCMGAGMGMSVALQREHYDW